MIPHIRHCGYSDCSPNRDKLLHGLRSEQVHTAMRTKYKSDRMTSSELYRLAVGIDRSPVSAFQAQRIARSICGLRNHCTVECKKPRGDQGNTNNIVCFQCIRVGHKRSQCPMLITNEPYKTAAMQQMTYVLSGRKFSPHQCDDSRGEGEIKL